MTDLTAEDRAVRNAEILRYYLAGMSQRKLAEKFGCSESLVYKVITKAGIRVTSEERRRRQSTNMRGPGVIWTPEMNRALIMARLSGKPIHKCADVVGVGSSLARKKLLEFGLNEGIAA